MTFLKTALMTGAVALTLATGALLTTAAPAEARMVCNNSGDCWHADGNYRYGRDVGASYHNDDWYFHQRWDGGDRHYREPHEGRGYYRSGVWIAL